MTEERAEPVLRVVRGDPDDEQLAALLAVVLSRTPATPAHHHRPGWSDRATRLRTGLRSGSGVWRTSTWR